jgi:hypothetical protein
LAGCTQAPPVRQGMAADQKLQTMLTGKVAGAPVNCIPAYRAGGAPSVVTPGAVAFAVNPGLIYVSNVQGSGCEDAADPDNILVTKSYGSLGLCSGDTLEIRDLQTKTIRGACTLSEFVPYRAAGRRY